MVSLMNEIFTAVRIFHRVLRSSAHCFVGPGLEEVRIARSVLILRLLSKQKIFCYDYPSLLFYCGLEWGGVQRREREREVHTTFVCFLPRCHRVFENKFRKPRPTNTKCLDFRLRQRESDKERESGRERGGKTPDI